jgi:hypothetical protein
MATVNDPIVMFVFSQHCNKRFGRVMALFRQRKDEMCIHSGDGRVSNTVVEVVNMFFWLRNALLRAPMEDVGQGEGAWRRQRHVKLEDAAEQLKEVSQQSALVRENDVLLTSSHLQC